MLERMQMMMNYDFETENQYKTVLHRAPHTFFLYMPILIEIVHFSLFPTFQYLTKQNNALREVNDTRLKIYENIEISIQDLEKQNHRLNVDNSNLKKINKK